MLDAYQKLASRFQIMLPVVVLVEFVLWERASSNERRLAPDAVEMWREGACWRMSSK